MSVTVSAVPILFLSAHIIAAISTCAVSASLKNAFENSAMDDMLEKINNPEELEKLKKIKYQLTKDEIDLLSKEYETPFMNNELLVRTLEEYGLDIVENKENCVVAKIERLIITFAKQEDHPYMMKIEFPKDCDEMQEDIVKDLFEEYGSNTQEETYIRIKDKIAQSNLYIEEEEVTDDNSIVLTISVD